MFFKVIILVITIKFITSRMQSDSYDEDLSEPMPSSVFDTQIDEALLQYLAKINGCICRWIPDKCVSCVGMSCQQFPVSLRTEVPYFKIKFTSISVIKKDDLLALSHLKRLEIDGNIKLVKLEAGCFREMNQLRNLSISANINLHGLSPELFKGLDNLERISLAKNAFRNILDVTTALSPSFVPNLMILEINENTFHTIEKNDFLSMNGTKLQQLNMYMCQTEYFHPESLAPLKELTTLRLGQNLYNVTTITFLMQKVVELNFPLDVLNFYDAGFRKVTPYSMLEVIGKSNTSYLCLARNHFDSITDESFPSMPELLDLDLRECLIGEISNNAFDKLVKLDTLELEGNKILLLDFNIATPTLIYLDLGNNCNNAAYFYISQSVFTNISLQVLHLPYNYMGHIWKSTFLYLTDLRVLNLKNTSLISIEDRAFINLTKLLRINLINNPLLGKQPLTAETFYGLESLQILLLGGCQILNLTSSPGLFTYTKNLTYLALERNNLHTINPNQLQHLQFLLTLDISENKLIAYNESILPHSKLTYLYAGLNKFTFVTTAMLEDWQSVVQLDLEGNPLFCDCTLYGIVVWLRTNTLKIQPDDDGNFVAKCVSPEKWRRKTIVDYITYLEDNSDECENFFLIHKFIIVSFLIILFLLTLVLVLLAYIYRWYVRYWIFLWRMSFHKHNLWTKKQSKLVNNSNYKFDAFVSYSHDDQQFVSHLVSQMENCEPYLKLCIYERNFQLGSNISDCIFRNVAMSKRTLLIISNAFAKSHWCRWETQLAEYHQIFFQNDNEYRPDDTLLMIKLEEVSKAYATPTLKYLLKTRIYLSWDPDCKKQEMFWKKLRTTLASPKGEIYENNFF